MRESDKLHDRAAQLRVMAINAVRMASRFWLAKSRSS
jgi:hypothetical protein